jgi:hypothetical protein
VLVHCGEGFLNVRRFDEAIKTLQNAVLIYRDIGDKRGEDMAIQRLQMIEQMSRSAISE